MWGTETIYDDTLNKRPTSILESENREIQMPNLSRCRRPDANFWLGRVNANSISL